MSKLADRLRKIKAGFLKQAPPQAVTVMNRATEDLKASGILTGIPPVGSVLPGFDLEATDGERFRTADLLAKGPVVVTFFRGGW